MKRYRSHFLEDALLIDILKEQNPAQYVLGGVVDMQAHTLWLLLGDLSSRTVPFKFFEA